MRRAALIVGGGVLLIVIEVGWLGAAHFDEQKDDRLDISAEAPRQEKVDLNQATIDELIRLPGITQALAARVIDHRPYHKLDDLVTRRVLGKKQFARIREYVVIHPRNP